MKKVLTFVIALVMVAALSVSAIALADSTAKPRTLRISVSRSDTMTFAGYLTLTEGEWFKMADFISAKDEDFDPTADLFSMSLETPMGSLNKLGAKLTRSEFGVTTIETANAKLCFNSVTNEIMFEGDPAELAALIPYIIANVEYAPEYVEPKPYPSNTPV